LFVCLFFSRLIPRPPRPTLFPSRRSSDLGLRGGIHNSVTRIVLKPTHMIGGYAQQSYGFNYYGTVGSNRDEFVIVRKMSKVDWRSEEHTSELQSRENLVCRLLLEKKKQRQ